MKRTVMAFGMGVALIVATTVLSAQEDQLTFGGQVRPRLESRAQGEGTRETFTSMRVRAQVQALLGDAGQIFIQLQDVRYFGEEANTLEDFRADALDLSLTHRMAPGLTAVGGYSFVQARDGIKELGRLEENAHWAYLMLNAFFR
jgi:hypothetical protein